jgi:hypothetical protein
MRRLSTARWMSAGFAGALAIAAAILARKGVGEPALHLALRATARWSYLLFWPAYAGGALAALLAPRVRSAAPLLRPLARHGREFGLAFAAAQLVHLALLVALYRIALRAPVSGAIFLFFGLAMVFTYVLALASIPAVSRALPQRALRLVRGIGVEYIALAFLYDFARNPFRGGIGNLVAYLPFLVLAIAAPLLRLGARLIPTRNAPRGPSVPAPHRARVAPRA